MLIFRVLIIAFFIVTAFSCGQQQPATHSGQDQLQDSEKHIACADRGPSCASVLRPLVEAKINELGVPGAIVFVDVPGSCQWTATFGKADVTKPRPILLRDYMRIGSVTKTFTGTAALQLVDEGSIALDDPISKHLSGVPNGDAITIRQMLNMTSGLYNYSEDLQFNASLDADPGRVWSIRELLAIAFAHPPYFPPGEGFHYSNTNTVLLGLLVEKVTGNPLGEEFERRIFRPLGMHHTSLPALDDSSISNPHPRGYMYGTNEGSLPGTCDAQTVGMHDVTNASPSWTWAAGGAISTLGDLKIWARSLALGTLLSPKTQAERLQWVPIGPPPAPRYGLAIANYNGVIGHDGALPGFQTFIGYVPDKKAKVIVLANVFPAKDCASPADEIVKVIAAELRLFSQ